MNLPNDPNSVIAMSGVIACIVLVVQLFSTLRAKMTVEAEVARTQIEENAKTVREKNYYELKVAAAEKGLPLAEIFDEEEAGDEEDAA